MNDNFIDLNHLIFECIERNDLTTLKHLLSFDDAQFLECLDDFSNTPFLYACHLGRYRIAAYLLAHGADYKRINIFGQNALTLATHSGNRNLCDIILHSIRFDELNGIGLLSPLCVATLQGNIDLMKIYLAMESPSTVQCASESIHGICPLKLAQIMNNVDLIELLQYKHQMHLKIPSDTDMNRTQS